MDVLFVPRLTVELAGYLIAVLPDLAPIILSLATPLALGALCGVLNERSGVVNIGIEGIMLTAAFTGYLTGFSLHATLGPAPAIAAGVIVAIVTGGLLGLLHAWLCVTVRADQIIAGTILNVGAIGLTAYFNRLIITPSGLGGAGVIAPLVFGLGPIALATVVLVAALQFLLFRSRWGLRTRAVGEHPKAADTVGIDVFRQRYQNVIAGCALAGCHRPGAPRGRRARGPPGSDPVLLVCRAAVPGDRRDPRRRGRPGDPARGGRDPVREGGAGLASAAACPAAHTWRVTDPCE